MNKRSLYIFISALLLASCGGGGGGGSEPSAPAPQNITVSLTSSADSAEVNSSITLTWSSTLATSCSASGSWSGSKATSGSESITIGVGGSNTFSLSCSASGANSGNASTTVNGLRYFDGTVFDGYIRGAEVFVDTNNNSSLDSDETSVTTDNQGNFTKLLYADGSVISKGGIDLDTGADLSSLTLAHKMVGFEASKIISPITSLAAYMAKPEDINAALGIDASIDLMSVDPIPNLGQSEYDYIYEKGNQLTVIAYSLQNSVNAINQTAETSQDYFLSIAEEIEKSYAASPGVVDIESNAFIEAVVENIIVKKASSMDATNKINMTSAISSVVPLIQVKSDAATTTAIQNFAFRTMQTDIQLLATGGASTGTVDNYNTNILTYISTDQNISSSDLEIDISALSDSASLDEDSSIEISPLTNDSYLRGQAVQLSIATSPANGSASLANEVITYTPDADWNGSESFTYSIAQGSKSATGTIEVTVAPINDAPVINTPNSISINESISEVISIDAEDVDGDSLTYSLSGIDNDLFTISSSGVLSFIATPDYESPSDNGANNIYDLTVSVSDGTDSVTQSITVTVTDVDEAVPNQAPTISSSATFSAAENQTAIGTVTATDADGDSLTYSISGSEINISSSGVLTFATAPDYETKSSYTATVTVSDGTASVTQDITVNVTDVTEVTNQAPVITSSATFSAAENQTAIGTVTATDADGDSLTYSISGSEINISSSGVLTFATAPDYETKNSYSATVTVSDGNDSVTQSITVTVSDSIEEMVKGTFYNAVNSSQYYSGSSGLDFGGIYNDKRAIIKHNDDEYLIALGPSPNQLLAEDNAKALYGYKLPLAFNNQDKILENPSFAKMTNGKFVSENVSNCTNTNSSGETIYYLSRYFTRLDKYKNYFGNNSDGIGLFAPKQDCNAGAYAHNDKYFVLSVPDIFNLPDDADFAENNLLGFNDFNSIEHTGSDRARSMYSEGGDFNGDGRDDIWFFHDAYITFSSDTTLNKDLNKTSDRVKLEYNNNSWSHYGPAGLNGDSIEDIFVPSNSSDVSPLCRYSRGSNNAATFDSGIVMIGKIVRPDNTWSLGSTQTIDLVHNSLSFTETSSDCTIAIDSGSDNGTFLIAKGLGYKKWYSNDPYLFSHNPWYKDYYSNYDGDGDGDKDGVFVLGSSGSETYDSDFENPSFEFGSPYIFIIDSPPSQGLNIYDVNASSSNYFKITFPVGQEIRGSKAIGDLDDDGKDELYVVLCSKGTEEYDPGPDCRFVVIFGASSQDDLSINLSEQNSRYFVSDNLPSTSLRYSLSYSYKHRLLDVADFDGDGKKDLLIGQYFISIFD